MGLGKQFKTDTNLETEGIFIDYGTDRIRIARAGGSNKKFARVLEQRTKPIRRALQVGAVDNDRSNQIMREVFAETVVLDWEVNQGTEAEPKWVQGIDPGDAGENGQKLLPVNFVNIMKVFVNLPDLFHDLQQQAQAGMLFRAEINEVAAGN